MYAKPTRFLFLLLAMTCLGASTASAQKLYPVTTDVPVIPSATSGMDSTGADVYYDIWQTTFKRLIQRINDGTVPAYGNDNKPIKLQAVLSQFRTSDTVTSFNPKTQEEELKIVRNYYELSELWEMLSALRIRQQWHITEAGAITKKVQAYAPLYPHGPLRYKPLYWCQPNAKAGLSHSLYLSYNVDMKSLGDSVAQKAFVKELAATLQSSSATVYDGEGDKRLTASQIASMLDKRSVSDTITMINPIDLTETTKISVSSEKVHIVKIRFTEEWTLDDLGNFSIRVIKYTPQMEIHWQPDNAVTLMPVFEVHNSRD